MNAEPKTFRMVSLGCPKNLVDSEVMAGALLQAGWALVDDGPAQIAVVNTCAFLTDAAEESVAVILEQIESKNEGEIEKLIVTGCLPERYRQDLADELTELDAVIGAEDFYRIAEIAEEVMRKGDRPVLLSDKQYLYDADTARLLSTPPWRAYLKLAEGCDNRCSYCLIGTLRGPYRSRIADSVIEEAHNLCDMGVREITLVAQDISYFGSDRPGGEGLAELILRLNETEGLRWLRLLYAHPAHLTVPMLEAMAAADKVVHYLDLPLQHIADPLLKSMNRKTTTAKTIELLDAARRLMPDIVLRTTFITGLPGETEADFETLMTFLGEQRFHQVGAFAFSPEEQTPAFSMEPKVPPELAQERRDALMAAQQEIAAQRWRERIGETVDILLEEQLHAEVEEDFNMVGRFYGQAPEIDGVTFCRVDSAAKPGQFVSLTITDATEYDLFAEENPDD